MGYLSKIKEKVTVKALLVCILLSMWVLGFMIMSRLEQSFNVRYAGYGDMPVKITDYPSSSSTDVMPVEIVNTRPVDVNIESYEAGEIPVSVENEFYDPVPIEVQ